MDETNLYADLAKHLDQGIVGTPKSPALLEILKILFPVEEAKIAVRLPMQNKTLSNKLNRVKNFLLWKRRMVYYQTTLEKYCKMLNRDKYNFLPHLKYKKNKGMNAIDRYVNFWYDNNLKLDNVFLENQTVIGLQNSRTPEWYKALSEKEVLEKVSNAKTILNLKQPQLSLHRIKTVMEKQTELTVGTEVAIF